MKNRLRRLKPCGCARCPPASNTARKKPLKTRETLMLPQKQQVGFPLKMGFYWFFPCSVWGGRKPTVALADKTQGENRRFSDLGLIR